MSEIHPTVEYRIVEGFPDYRVGNDGSIWSKMGSNRHYSDWTRMNPRRGIRGHLNVVLWPGKKSKYVHRLVLEAFVGPCPKGMQCCHFPDRNPSNNAVANLRWGTDVENKGDAKIHGTTTRGTKNPCAKLNDHKVRAIRKLYAKGKLSQAAIAKRFRVSQTTISDAISGGLWSHVV